jgi:hypothetical protein
MKRKGSVSIALLLWNMYTFNSATYIRKVSTFDTLGSQIGGWVVTSETWDHDDRKFCHSGVNKKSIICNIHT